MNQDNEESKSERNQTSVDHGDMMLANKSDYLEAVAATAGGGKPLVIDFTATWCGPCQQIGPVFVGLVAKYPELVLKKLDVDANAEGAQEAEVDCMPTFKVYKNGKEVDKLEGADNRGLIKLLNKAKVYTS